MIKNIKHKLLKLFKIKKKTITIQELSNRRPLVMSNSTPESLSYGVRRRAREFEPDGQMKKIRKLTGTPTIYDNIESKLESFTLSMSNQIRLDYKNTAALLDYDKDLVSLYKSIAIIYNEYLPKEEQIIFEYKQLERYKEYVDFNKGDKHKLMVNNHLIFLQQNKENITKTIYNYSYAKEFMSDYNKLIKLIMRIERDENDNTFIQKN